MQTQAADRTLPALLEPRDERRRNHICQGGVATYIVTKVRKETSTDGTHKHIEGVCTNNGTH
jgi:hypothetical protein